MTRLVNRTLHLEGLADMFADRAMLALATSDIEPTTALSDWLARLAGLHGLPYRYLVPNARFLPDESIRFFQVDGNWVHALLEGAMSIGQASDAEIKLHAATRNKLHGAARRGSLVAAPKDVVTGFLLRSQVVPGWPKLEIVAYDANGAELHDVRRLELLSPSVLLYMVAGTIDHIVLREPSIGLHAGIDIDGTKPLRYVTVPATAPVGTHAGDQIEGVSASVDFRPGARRVLRVAALASLVKTLLDTHQANTGSDGKPLPFTSAEFALEMIEGTQAVTFRSQATNGE